jgi:DNA-binding PadR family transcriptional regulator
VHSKLKILETAGIIPTLLALAIKNEAMFTEIKNITGVGSGSLYRALKKLEEQGLVIVDAKIVNNRAVKVFRLTEDGKELARRLKRLVEFFEKRKR